MRQRLFALVLPGLLCAAAQAGEAPRPPAMARQKLLGKHRLTLQWISWDHPGSAEVAEEGGALRLRGEQRSKEKGEASGDYLKIDGVIQDVTAKSFVFSGRIETRVSHIAGGKVCVREGRMTFRISGKRRYYRLKEMDNPCDVATDYVDLYF